ERGRRDSMTIASRAFVHHGVNTPGAKRCATIAHTSPIGMDTEPRETPTAMVSASSAASGARKSHRGRRRGGGGGASGARPGERLVGLSVTTAMSAPERLRVQFAGDGLGGGRHP